MVFFFVILFILIVGLVLLYNELREPRLKLITVIINIIAILGVIALIRLAYIDQKAYSNAEILEIETVKITKVNYSSLNIIYWVNDSKLQKETINLENIKIGDKVKLAIKEDIDYKLWSGFYEHEKV